MLILDYNPRRVGRPIYKVFSRVLQIVTEKYLLVILTAQNRKLSAEDQSLTAIDG